MSNLLGNVELVKSKNASKILRKLNNMAPKWMQRCNVWRFTKSANWQRCSLNENPNGFHTNRFDSNIMFLTNLNQFQLLNSTIGEAFGTGYLEFVSGAITSHIGSGNTTSPDELKLLQTITDPLTKGIVQVNQSIHSLLKLAISRLIIFILNASKLKWSSINRYHFEFKNSNLYDLHRRINIYFLINNKNSNKLCAIFNIQ